MKTTLFFFLLLSCSYSLWSQDFQLSGIISAAESSTPIPGASIILAVSGKSITTDPFGRYCFKNIQQGIYTLKISAEGFESTEKSIQIDSNIILSVNLLNSAIKLKELTIIAGKPSAQSDLITSVDKLLRPVNTAQDLLRLVPGLFIAQHAGGGKAEQIFLRGFDSDHGTDFYISLDGMPVNMVSHAHGQGYADFHFVIPETIEKLKVYKGPYATKFGDFSTSGSGEFLTRNHIETSQLKMEVGRFNTYRVMTILNLLGDKHLLSKEQENLYVAGEYVHTNSYFTSKQHFNRLNLFAKYSGALNKKNMLSFSVSTFAAKWDASGQVPERAILNGMISRFGSIDSSEGGKTSRTNVNTSITTLLRDNTILKNQIYYVNYQFKLFSNFTFFLKDPINGDEIAQTDKRNILGYLGTLDHDFQTKKVAIHLTSGFSVRNDNSHIALQNSVQREVIGTVSKGVVNQTNISNYEDLTFLINDNFSINTGIRFDYFQFEFINQVNSSLSGKKAKFRVSPKINLSYKIDKHIQLFAKSGLGFHSNDARSVVSNTATNSVPIALGYEVGAELKIFHSMFVNVALWGLHMQSELVYVGDDGTVETNFPTRRLGIDFGFRCQMGKNFFADVDLNYTHGRLVGPAKGKNYIPLAPTLTSIGGLTYRNSRGFSASIRYRYINSRPANEANTVVAKGYYIMDAVLNYKIKLFSFGITAENILNSKWNEAQFDTESKLKNETTSVSELHFTPGTPFQIKGSISINF